MSRTMRTGVLARGLRMMTESLSSSLSDNSSGVAWDRLMLSVSTCVLEACGSRWTADVDGWTSGMVWLLVGFCCVMSWSVWSDDVFKRFHGRSSSSDSDDDTGCVVLHIGHDDS